MTQCRHGVPWYACARMCPDPAIPQPQPSRAGWIPVIVLAVLVAAAVLWKVTS